MINYVCKVVSRWVPFVLIVVAALIVLNAIFEGLSFVREAFYAGLLLALAGAFVRFDSYKEKSE